MLRFPSYDIVFQEVPGEVTLAVNLSNCPNRCRGCHSPHLKQDIGQVLDEDSLAMLLEVYGNAITCVCFMGGDASPYEVGSLAGFIKEQAKGRIKTAWYSGKSALPTGVPVHVLDYVKLGPYIEHLGGLDAATTNQRFYRIENGKMIDMTNLFHKKIPAVSQKLVCLELEL